MERGHDMQLMECDHVAPVAGRMTVFCALQYPVDEPPETIVIHGVIFRRDDSGGDG